MNEHDMTEQAYKNGYDKGYEDGKRDATPKWIHIRDRNRLPEEGKPVLVYTYMNGDQIKAVRRGEKWYSTWDNTPLVYVSHWTPLPESPKGYYDAYA